MSCRKSSTLARLCATFPATIVSVGKPGVHHVATGRADDGCQRESQENHAGRETDAVVEDAGATNTDSEGASFVVTYLGQAGNDASPPLAPTLVGESVDFDGLEDVHEQHGDEHDQGYEHGCRCISSTGLCTGSPRGMPGPRKEAGQVGDDPVPA